MSFKNTANTLKKLDELFDAANYAIRYEKGNFNSGYCIMEERRIVVVNKFLNIEGKINALTEILLNINIDEAGLSGELLKMYQQIKMQASVLTTNQPAINKIEIE